MVPHDFTSGLTQLKTPAFVFDEHHLATSAKRAYAFATAAGSTLLYSPKACSIPGVISILGKHVDGFACSSIYEGKTAREVSGKSKSMHLTTPNIQQGHLSEISSLFDYVVLNSWTQTERLASQLAITTKVGLRVNPQLSFAEDERYDPCRKNSKLGVPLDRLKSILKQNPEQLQYLNGLHFHNNCDSINGFELARTVNLLAEAFPEFLEKMEWINLGGGYLYDELENSEAAINEIKRLRDRFNVEVFIEPGASLVREAGSIVSRVVDIFDGDDVKIAVLDTTVNHMPEVMEYEFVPDVLGHTEGSNHQYLLAGATCLAGDHFGISHFDYELKIGSIVTFPNAGAYTISRANIFNGVPLPHIYKRTLDGEFCLEREASHDDFSLIIGEKSHASV